MKRFTLLFWQYVLAFISCSQRTSCPTNAYLPRTHVVCHRPLDLHNAHDPAGPGIRPTPPVQPRGNLRRVEVLVDAHRPAVPASLRDISGALGSAGFSFFLPRLVRSPAADALCVEHKQWRRGSGGSLTSRKGGFLEKKTVSQHARTPLFILRDSTDTYDSGFDTRWVRDWDGPCEFTAAERYSIIVPSDSSKLEQALEPRCRVRQENLKGASKNKMGRGNRVVWSSAMVTGTTAAAQAKERGLSHLSLLFLLNLLCTLLCSV